MKRSEINKNNSNIGKDNSIVNRIAACKCAYSVNEENQYDMIIHENASPINNNNSRGTINEN